MAPSGGGSWRGANEPAPQPPAGDVPAPAPPAGGGQWSGGTPPLDRRFARSGGGLPLWYTALPLFLILATVLGTLTYFLFVPDRATDRPVIRLVLAPGAYRAPLPVIADPMPSARVFLHALPEDADPADRVFESWERLLEAAQRLSGEVTKEAPDAKPVLAVYVQAIGAVHDGQAGFLLTGRDDGDLPAAASARMLAVGRMAGDLRRAGMDAMVFAASLAERPLPDVGQHLTSPVGADGAAVPEFWRRLAATELPAGDTAVWLTAVRGARWATVDGGFLHPLAVEAALALDAHPSVARATRDQERERRGAWELTAGKVAEYLRGLAADANAADRNAAWASAAVLAGGNGGRSFRIRRENRAAADRKGLLADGKADDAAPVAVDAEKRKQAEVTLENLRPSLEKTDPQRALWLVGALGRIDDAAVLRRGPMAAALLERVRTNLGDRTDQETPPPVAAPPAGAEDPVPAAELAALPPADLRSPSRRLTERVAYTLRRLPTVTTEAGERWIDPESAASWIMLERAAADLHRLPPGLVADFDRRRLAWEDRRRLLLAATAAAGQYRRDVPETWRRLADDLGALRRELDRLLRDARAVDTELDTLRGHAGRTAETLRRLCRGRAELGGDDADIRLAEAIAGLADPGITPPADIPSLKRLAGDFGRRLDQADPAAAGLVRSDLPPAAAALLEAAAAERPTVPQALRRFAAVVGGKELPDRPLDSDDLRGPETFAVAADASTAALWRTELRYRLAAGFRANEHDPPDAANRRALEEIDSGYRQLARQAEIERQRRDAVLDGAAVEPGQVALAQRPAFASEPFGPSETRPVEIPLAGARDGAEVVLSWDPALLRLDRESEEHRDDQGTMTFRAPGDTAALAVRVRPLDKLRPGESTAIGLLQRPAEPGDAAIPVRPIGGVTVSRRAVHPQLTIRDIRDVGDSGGVPVNGDAIELEPRPGEDGESAVAEGRLAFALEPPPETPSVGRWKLKLAAGGFETALPLRLVGDRAEFFAETAFPPAGATPAPIRDLALTAEVLRDGKPYEADGRPQRRTVAVRLDLPRPRVSPKTAQGRLGLEIQPDPPGAVVELRFPPDPRPWRTFGPDDLSGGRYVVEEDLSRLDSEPSGGLATLAVAGLHDFCRYRVAADREPVALDGPALRVVEPRGGTKILIGGQPVGLVARLAGYLADPRGPRLGLRLEHGGGSATLLDATSLPYGHDTILRPAAVAGESAVRLTLTLAPLRAVLDDAAIGRLRTGRWSVAATGPDRDDVKIEHPLLLVERDYTPILEVTCPRDVMDPDAGRPARVVVRADRDDPYAADLIGGLTIGFRHSDGRTLVEGLVLTPQGDRWSVDIPPQASEQLVPAGATVRFLPRLTASIEVVNNDGKPLTREVAVTGRSRNLSLRRPEPKAVVTTPPPARRIPAAAATPKPPPPPEPVKPKPVVGKLKVVVTSPHGRGGTVSVGGTTRPIDPNSYPFSTTFDDVAAGTSVRITARKKNGEVIKSVDAAPEASGQPGKLKTVTL